MNCVHQCMKQDAVLHLQIKSKVVFSLSVCRTGCYELQSHLNPFWEKKRNRFKLSTFLLFALVYSDTDQTRGGPFSIPSQETFPRQHKGSKAGRSSKEACQRTCRTAPGHRHVATRHLNDEAALAASSFFFLFF